MPSAPALKNTRAGKCRGTPGPGNPSAQNHPWLHGANPSTGCRSTSDKIESVKLPPRKSSLQTAESAEGGSFLTEHRIWKRVFKIHAGHRIPAPQAADFKAPLTRNLFQRSRPHKSNFKRIRQHAAAQIPTKSRYRCAVCGRSQLRVRQHPRLAKFTRAHKITCKRHAHHTLCQALSCLSSNAAISGKGATLRFKMPVI